MSANAVRRVSRYVRNHPWAILEEKLDAIVEVVDARMQGVTLSEAEIRARLGADAVKRQATTVDAVAIVPLHGILAQKMNMMTEISGGTSTEQFIAQVRQLAADPSIKAIVIDADSPGGTVDGAIEAADALYKLRGTKPMVAVANPLMASAAYWLLSQCEEIVGAPSAMVGSIGVFCVHEDLSGANTMMGIKPTYIAAGDYKTEGNPDEPLSEDAKSYLQRQVDARYGDFLAAIVRGRGKRRQDILDSFGQGRVLLAADALRVGMIDRIATLEDTIGRLVAGPPVRLRGQVAVGHQLAATARPMPDDEMDEPKMPPADEMEPMSDTMEPDADGRCQEGYEMRDDQLCHRMSEEEMAARSRQRQADFAASTLAAIETSTHG